MAVAAALAAALALTTTACQRVPLLAPSGSSITLTSSTTVLAINGTTDLIAQVLESAGTPPHTGTRVSFTTTLGTVQPSEADTDISGRVIVRFLAGTASGTATITAFSGGAGGAAPTATGGAASTPTTPANTVKIAIGAAAVAGVFVSALPTTVSNLGGPSTITANVRDTNGNALPGVPVAFTTDNGSLSAAVAVTDQNGNAQTVLTTSKVSKVTATAGVGSGTGTTATAGQTGTVTINVNVVATISVGAPSPTSPSVGQSVTFPFTYVTDANSSSVQSVTVDFGDGSRATTYPGKPPSVTHSYAAIGSYSIRATLLDALGDTSTASGSVNIAALGSVTVGAPSPSAPTVGQAVTFPLTFSATGGSPIQRLTVDFGDNSVEASYTGAPGSVSHTYTSAGTFAIRVTAFDSFGNTSTGGASVTVGPLAPVAVGAPSPASPTVGQAVTFPVTYSTSGGSPIQRLSVDYGDGSAAVPYSGTPGSISHTYTFVGTFAVRVTAFDGFGNQSVSGASVTVGSLTSPTVGAPSPSSPSVGQAVTFPVTYASSGSSSIQRVSAEFGDGASSNYTGAPSSVSHTYSSSGTFSVRVTAFDAYGNSATGGTSVLIAARPQPVVSINAPSITPTAGTDTTFTVSVSPAAGSGTNIVDVTIDFGEPGVGPTGLGPLTGTNIPIHHTYNTANTFRVVLTATDSNGGRGTATTIVFVQAATPLGVTLNASATIGAVTTVETFTATVTGLGNAVVLSYLWEFGNGDSPQTTTTNQITHAYAHGTGTNPPSYTVKVTVTTSAATNNTASNTTVITP